MKSLFTWIAAAGFAVSCFGQDYAAEQITDHGIAIVRLLDRGRHVEVKVVPSVGNRAYEMNVNGKNILDFPFADVAAFRGRPALCGIPFLAPWANRLGEQAFW